MSAAFDRILDKLRDDGRPVRQQGTQAARSTCPAHGGDNPTALSVRDGDTRVGLTCHTQGCDGADILAGLGLSVRDRYHDPKGASYEYTNLDGLVSRRVTRTPSKGFSQPYIVGPPTLYRLPQVVAAVKAGTTVYLVEGEEDVHAIESVGGVATTAPAGAQNVGRCDLTPLHGAHVVAVVDQDENQAGQKWAQAVAERLHGHAADLTFVHAATGKDVDDHITAGHSLDDLVQVEADDPAARARRLLPRLDWHELWADDTKDEWIHEPLLPARRLVSVYSAPKVGKSLLLLEFAVCVSRAEPILGFTPTKRWRVLYVDFENDPRGDVRSRLQAMGYGPDDLDHLDYLSFPALAGLDGLRGGLELMEAVKAYGSEVVVIDTVSRSVDGEENSNDTWLGFYRHTGLLLKQAGVAMIRLDHSGKDETKGTRGGSAKSGDVDAIWRLTRVTDERFRMECTDSRMQIDTKVMHITRQRLPRLHHSVDNLMVSTDREAKVAYLAGLADEAQLPHDAGREQVRALAKSRGVTARNDVLAEVVRARKATSQQPVDNSIQPVDNLSPASGTGHPTNHCPHPPGTVGDNIDVSAGQPLSPASGTVGDNPHQPYLSPGQQYLTAPTGTAGQAAPCSVCSTDCGVVLHAGQRKFRCEIDQESS